jgi:hypothetical protein
MAPLTVSGIVAALPSPTQEPPAPVTYKMTSGDWKATAIVSADGSFQWTALNGADEGTQIVYGTSTEGAGDTKVFAPRNGRFTDADGFPYSLPNLPRYRAVLDPSEETLTIYDASNGIYMVYSIQQVLKLVHSYSGTFVSDDLASTGSFQIKLYSDNTVECTWRESGGSMSIGPGAGRYTTSGGSFSGGTVKGLGDFGYGWEHYTIALAGTVAGGGSYSIAFSGSSTGDWTITRIIL